MKVVAMYLPQYHTVPENDEWWGEGYTDWVAVRNAYSYYPGHDQPKIPLGEEYYDLLKKDTMIKQTKLMTEYGIDGMCFYHYYFENGKRVLQEPAENLLKWKDINMPFCFSWANESWIATWSNISEGNAWVNKCNISKAENKNGVLLEQKYGEKSDWIKHFEYLLPFFKDERYIRIDGKPLFLIYKVGMISCLKEMVDTWNELAHQNGIDGLYIVGSNIEESQRSIIDKELVTEPQHTLHRCFINIVPSGAPKTYGYDQVWDRLLKYPILDENTMIEAFVNYDDTPRHGKNGTVIDGGSPQKFYEYMIRLMGQEKQRNNELIFVNAWNEWGEGMYLEPDCKTEYGYLQAIRDAKSNFGICERTDMVDKQKNGEYINELKEEIDNLRKINSRYRTYWKTLDILLYRLENKIDWQNVLRVKGLKRVAVYGVGLIGKHIVKELQESGVDVVYGIDKYKEGIIADIPILSLDIVLPNVDIVIVTVGHDYELIKKELQKKVRCPVISIDELLDMD